MVGRGAAITLFNGDWGNLDAIGGLRMLFVGATSDYTLTNDTTLPDRTITLSRSGSLNLNASKVQGIGGLVGRINVPNSSFYVPFYFDAGGAGVPFTWQAYGGIAYRAAEWADVSLGYRYLSLQGGSRNGVQGLNLGGAILVANLRF